MKIELIYWSHCTLGHPTLVNTLWLLTVKNLDRKCHLTWGLMINMTPFHRNLALFNAIIMSGPLTPALYACTGWDTCPALLALLSQSYAIECYLSVSKFVNILTYFGQITVTQSMASQKLVTQITVTKSMVLKFIYAYKRTLYNTIFIPKFVSKCT